MSNDHGSVYLSGSAPSSAALGIPSRTKNDDIVVKRSSGAFSSFMGASGSFPRPSHFGSYSGSVDHPTDLFRDKGRTKSLIERTPSSNWRTELNQLEERNEFTTTGSTTGSESSVGSTATIRPGGGAEKRFEGSREYGGSDGGTEERVKSPFDLTEVYQQISALNYARPAVGHLNHYTFPYDLCIGFDNRWSFGNPFPPTDTAVDSKAIEHRKSALYAEPRCTWSGQLPHRQHKNPTYSPKVFLGGVPWDITDMGLSEAFNQFGQIRVQWPGKEPRGPTIGGSPKQGYLYAIFESDKRVKELLQSCTHDFSNGGKYYFNISSKRMRSKEVQVIPWIISDSNYVRCPSQRLDPSKTVFVGALHGMLTAEGLAHVANDLFGGVAYVGIDTDKFKYPIGSGRVTFNNQKSYMKAVQAAFVDIKATRFTKKVFFDS